jgi:hypothetical protein
LLWGALRLKPGLLLAKTAGELLIIPLRSFERLHFCTSAGRMRIFQFGRLAESAPRIIKLKSTFLMRGTGFNRDLDASYSREAALVAPERSLQVLKLHLT